VEAKIVQDGRVPTACREAIAQLLDYRHFLYDEAQQVSLVALFDQDVGGAYLSFLRAHDVSVVWRAGSGWTGCPMARKAGLV
jgi:hypothetical protein